MVAITHFFNISMSCLIFYTEYVLLFIQNDFLVSIHFCFVFLELTDSEI